MKAILLSIRPEWLVKILNGEKTIEVRKLFPKDYVGWVYLYCSKEHNYKDLLIHNTSTNLIFLNKVAAFYKDDWERTPYLQILNGKVVARFWCDKVETLGIKYGKGWETDTMTIKEIEQKSCLDRFKLYDYLKGKNGFAIHFSKLEIFDRPRELSEFQLWCNNICNNCKHLKMFDQTLRCRKPMLTKAPQNYCWVEE